LCGLKEGGKIPARAGESATDIHVRKS
jgi:hypothetical protein